MAFIFYTCSLIAVISTFLTIIQKNAVYSLLFLVISILSISGIFFSLGAVFSGALEVIVYAGAVMVLFIFVVMMLNLGDKDNQQEQRYLQFNFWIKPIFLSLVLFCFMAVALFSLKELSIDYSLIDLKSTGIKLFSSYALLVELVSMLLLSALITVFHIGIEKKYSCDKKGY